MAKTTEKKIIHFSLFYRGFRT